MSRPASNHGMTLVEMMVALAIVSLLTGGALSVATSLSRGRRLDERKTAKAAIAEGIEAVLAADIRNAAKYRTRSGGIELQTRASLDVETFALSHLPVTVIYETREIAGDRWLVRKQRAGGRDVLTELVCRNVASVALKPIGGSARSTGALREMPPSVEIVVEFTDSSRRPVRTRYRIR